jgi:hypothetical protein
LKLNIKNFSLEHIVKSAGDVSIVDNYGKICLVDLKIVCCPRVTVVKKKYGKISEKIFQTLF